MSIEQNGAGVEKDPAQQTNNNNINLTIEARADSALTKVNGVTTTDLKEGKLILAKELKELVSFRALLEADGHKVQQSGRYVKCCCPFHPDRTPSFFINEEDNYGHCYGCDWHGNIYDYEEKWHRVDFTTAWLRLNDFYYHCPRAGRKARSIAKKVTQDEPQFTPRQLRERKQYAERLATESWLADEVCRERFKQTGEKWNPNTIRALAREGSLGWASGALAFIYPRGTKYRDWPGKDFIWESDGSSLWRGQLLAGAKHVYLTESETDAIALLDADIEREEGAAVLAVSGASGFHADWAPEFKNKVVTFCFDTDDAGIKGANRTGLFLKPHASAILTLDLGGAI